ncbi:MAG: hemerythrin domain-containing protein [Caldimonas sp.]
MARTPDISRQTASVPPDAFVCLDDFHRRTAIALVRLAALMTNLLHGETQAGTRDLAWQVIEHFSVPARQHHQDEERYVFPPLIDGGDPETVQAVLRLQQDHGWLEEDWMELAPHLAAVASGQGWYDLDLLREGANVFIALSYDHIALEESLIYPQARALLGARERSEMDRAMADRRSKRNRSQGPARK